MLDIFVVNGEWRAMFQDVWVESLVARCSNHKPMVLTITRVKNLRKRRKHMFRFEASWLKEEECERLVAKVWSEKQMTLDPMTNVQRLPRVCSGRLANGFRKKDKEMNGNIELLTERIKRLQEMERLHNTTKIHKLKLEVGKLLEQEDIRWKKRAKRSWYCLGDKNTKFIHSYASQRKKKNQILYVVDDQSEVKEDQEEIVEAFREHFAEVYKSGEPSREVIEECVNSMGARVTNSMVEELEKKFY
ncbi:uncharacterized protein LOC108984568 [Juglans regia]|nr:uncharacterized protein LOC108984568 [Juglans regia]